MFVHRNLSMKISGYFQTRYWLIILGIFSIICFAYILEGFPPGQAIPKYNL